MNVLETRRDVKRCSFAACRTYFVSNQGIFIEMPRAYTEHPLFSRLRELLDASALWDIELFFRQSGRSERSSGFLLSLVSRVWQQQLCGNFKEAADRQLVLEDVDADALKKLLDLACCKSGTVVSGVTEVVELALLADRYEMTEVQASLEEETIRRLSLENCWEILNMEARMESGLGSVIAASRSMALKKFEAFSSTAGFQTLDEVALGTLLDDDELSASSEQKVLESLSRWMVLSDTEPVRGEHLLQKIRWGCIEEEYLVSKAKAVIPGCKFLDDIIVEALSLHQCLEGQHGVYKLLTAKAFDPRAEEGVGRVGLSRGSVLGAGELLGPRGVALDCHGRVVVADSANDRVLVLNSDGSVARCLVAAGRVANCCGFSGGTGSSQGAAGVPAVGIMGGGGGGGGGGSGTFMGVDSGGGGGGGGGAVAGGVLGENGSLMTTAVQGGLSNPFGVAVDRAGNIIVADSGNHCVRIFRPDPAQSPPRRDTFAGGGGIASAGPGAGPVAGTGVVVAARGVGCVCAVGAGPAVLGSKGSGRGQLLHPCGVAVDLGGCVVVADHCNDRVQAFRSCDGSVAYVLGAAGAGVGQLNRPWGVAVDRAGRIVVADGGNHRVQIFSTDGSVHCVIGGGGGGGGGGSLCEAVPAVLQEPWGVAVDRAGRIIVSDFSRDRVQVFKRDGTIEKTLGCQAAGPGQMAHPCGVAVDRDGLIVVADFANDRIQIL